jgi:hypothetical protein
MGTRSLTSIFDGNVEVCTMYRQFDGYPAAHGVELMQWLAPIDIVDNLHNASGNSANGAGCLAAQMVEHFKRGPGGIYLYPSGTRDVGEMFRYEVHVTKPNTSQGFGTVQVKIISGGHVLFIGSPVTALEWTKGQ